MASQLGCVCRMAAHEGHRSGFCDTIGMGTDGDGRRLIGSIADFVDGEARGRGILIEEKAPSLPSFAA